MTRNFQIGMQAILICIQFLVPAFAHLNTDQAVAVSSVVAALQALFGIAGHTYNVDGTLSPATSAVAPAVKVLEPVVAVTPEPKIPEVPK